MELKRYRHLDRLESLITRYPVVAILGARQVGKTTLARQFAARVHAPTTFFDLENPEDLAQLDEPMLALRDLHGIVVLDEIQRRPELFPVLRVLADRRDVTAAFLLLGSAAPDLLRQSSESLAGRIHYHTLSGFNLDETGTTSIDRLWLRGGFPNSFLANSDEESAEWRRDFIRTYLERDLPALGIRTPSVTLQRFWTMLAHYHAQVWNGAELARAFGVTAPTVRHYLDTLSSALVLRQLQPWYENISKRQVKAPKVYIADSGLLHALLNLPTHDDLVSHPKVGASWEGFALSEVISHLGAHDDEVFFWATHSGAELDLLVIRGRMRLGFEFKRTSAPRTTRSMRAAIQTLKLDRLDVVHAGERTFQMADQIRAVALKGIFDNIDRL